MKLSDWIRFTGPADITVGWREYKAHRCEMKLIQHGDPLIPTMDIYELKISLTPKPDPANPFQRPTKRSQTALGLRRP